MALQLFANNATGYLASSITDFATSLTVVSGQGSSFPIPTGSDYFYATLVNGTTIEIVKVTARSSDTFTIVRAQQSTSANTFPQGSKFELRATKENFNNFVQLSGAQTVTDKTLTTGNTWQGNTIGVQYGGTGATTLTGLVKGNGTSAFTAASAGTDYLAPAAIGVTVQGYDANTAKLNIQQSFTKPQRPSLSTETAPSANTITWDLTTDQILRINLNANITTFNLTGTLSSLAGNQYQVIVRYNSGTAITWNANIKWPAGTAPTLTGTSGKVDTFTFVVSSTDGTNYYLLNTGKTQNL